ncbi:MAG: Lrp/AsnC family transcriptional regulator [Desulfobacterales bacterium]
MLTDIEKRVIAAIQGDIAVTGRPYRRIAESLDIPEDRLLEILRDLCDRGVIRRFGATIRHQKSGFTANAMVAWRVEEERIETVGRIMAGFRQVSHCYRRNPTGDWPYNLYTMVHARNEATCHETARKMAEKSAVTDYALLFSRRELKKTSMRYFPPRDEENPEN